MRKTRWLWGCAAMMLWAGVAQAQQAPSPQGRNRSADGRPHAELPGKSAELKGRPGDPHGKPGDPQGRPGDPQGRPNDPSHAEKTDGTKPRDPNPTRPASDSDRPARRKRQLEAERTHVNAAVVNRPMDDALRQELRNHAERVARLERIQALVEQSGDTAAAARVKKLMEQENARYEAVLASRK